MWLVYALIAGIATALGALVAKKAVLYVKDPLLRSFYFSFFVFILLLPFFLFEFDIPKDFNTIILLLISSIVIVIGNYFIFKSYIYLSPSSINVIHKLKLVWILLIGLLFLKQSLIFKDIIGMSLVLIASLVMIDYKNWKADYHGVIAVIISTLSFSAFAFSLSILSQNIKSYSLLFYITIIPAILNWIMIKDFKKKILQTYKKTGILIAAAVLGAIYNLFMIFGVKEEPTKVFFVIEAGIIVILLGEYFWIGDKKNVLWKIIGVTLAIIGTILLR